MAIELVTNLQTCDEQIEIVNDNFIELEGSINELNPDGLAWVFQAGPPDSSDGFDGDMYFDTTNAIFYGPKVDGAWPAEGVEAGGGGGNGVWEPVRVMSFSDITLSGEQTIDTVAVVTDDRVLVNGQSDFSQNGIYVVAVGAWTRAQDASATGDFAHGKLVLIAEGFDHSGSLRFQAPSSAITVGTDDIWFDQAGGYGSDTTFGLARKATQSEVNAGDSSGYPAYATAETLFNYPLINKDSKTSVRVATTANITLSGAQTIDGISVVAGNRVLVKNQSTGSQNGIYLCASGSWTRTTDADASAKVTPQMYMRVEEGTANANKVFYLSNTGTVTLGTTALTFADGTGGTPSAASETVAGIAEIATQTETDTGTDDARIVTPLKLAGRTSTETRAGVVELATDAETQTGTDTARAITPANLSARSATETRSGVAELATQTETDTGTDDVRIVTALKIATRYLAKAGGTLTGFLTLHADPTSALHAVTKQYADALVAGGASPASETVAGIAELATQTETNTGTDDARIVTPLKLANYSGLGATPDATETVKGKAELATQTETDTGTDDARIVTPLKLASRTATDTRAGVVELATDGETQTGTDTARAITPANLSARSATETRSGVAEIATQTETDTGTDDTRMVTPLKLASYSGLGGGSGYATLVTLGSDVSTTVFSYADVTALSVAVSSGVAIRFRFTILFTVNATGMGTRWSINGPGITSLGYHQFFATGAGGSAITSSARSTYDTSSTTGGTPSTSGNFAKIEGILVPSASGTLIARFSTDGTAGTVTAKAGSTLETW